MPRRPGWQFAAGTAIHRCQLWVPGPLGFRRGDGAWGCLRGRLCLIAGIAIQPLPVAGLATYFWQAGLVRGGLGTGSAALLVWDGCALDSVQKLTQGLELISRSIANWRLSPGGMMTLQAACWVLQRDLQHLLASNCGKLLPVKQCFCTEPAVAAALQYPGAFQAVQDCRQWQHRYTRTRCYELLTLFGHLPHHCWQAVESLMLHNVCYLCSPCENGQSPTEQRCLLLLYLSADTV